MSDDADRPFDRGGRSEVGQAKAPQVEWIRTARQNEVGHQSRDYCWDFPLLVIHSSRVCHAMLYGGICVPRAAPDRGTAFGAALWAHYEATVADMQRGEFSAVEGSGHTLYEQPDVGVELPNVPTPLHELALADPLLHEAATIYQWELGPDWTDRFTRITGQIPLGIVWVTNPSNPEGFPHPLTDEARALLTRFQREAD